MQRGGQQICWQDESAGSGLPPPCSSQSKELLEAIIGVYLFYVFVHLLFTKLSRCKQACLQAFAC